MANADQFKLLTFKSKIGQKRPHDQMIAESKADDPKFVPNTLEAETLKRRNLGDGNFASSNPVPSKTTETEVVEAESNSSDKENTSKNTI